MVGRTRTAAIVLASALLHLLALTWLTQGAPTLLQAPRGSSGPAMDVTLIRLAPQPTRRPPAPGPVAGAPSLQKPVPARPVDRPETARENALAPSGPATSRVAVGCDREIRLLLTPQEREACDTAAAVASAGDGSGFRAGGGPQEISRIPAERAVEFDVEMAEKRSRRDMSRAAAQLAAAEAEAARRRAPAWTGQGQGADVSIRFDCAVKFSGMRLGRPKCRFSGGISP